MSEQDGQRAGTAYGFPKARRVTSGNDFSRIIRGGAVAADDTLVVNALRTETSRCGDSPSGANAGRLGVTIPTKTGSAVVRNRWKRLIREAYRLQQHELPAGFDFIVRPRRGAVAEFSRVHQSLVRLARRAATRVESAQA